MIRLLKDFGTVSFA